MSVLSLAKYLASPDIWTLMWSACTCVRCEKFPRFWGMQKPCQARFTLGRSCEINCPTIPLQLAGSKKIQKALICPDMVERIMYDSEADAVKNTSSEELRKTWMPTWPRHGQDVPWFQHPRETTPARTLATSLVLKLGVMCSNLISCLSWTAYLLTVSDMFGSQWS